MNKIDAPDIDDDDLIDELADTLAMVLKPAVMSVQQAYKHYRDNDGDALQIASIPLSADQKDVLHYYYRNPPSILSFINDLRDDHEDDSCPMCGSLSCGQLDHLLPKEHYPQYSIFSNNLVPACKCNIGRGTTIVGTAAGERILHPYFDDCMAKRLVTCQFSDFDGVPKVSLRLLINRRNSKYQAIKFHFDTLIDKKRVRRYLVNRWNKMCRNPRLVIRRLPKVIPSRRHLKSVLEEELDFCDDLAKNNWHSIFVHGLLAHRSAFEWLFVKLTTPGRKPTDPLN